MPKTYASLKACHEALPPDAKWSCSFGYPGQGGFTAYYKTHDGKRYVVSNGKWDETSPFTWTLTRDYS